MSTEEKSLGQVLDRLAAAPDMCRALLALEIWHGCRRKPHYDGHHESCIIDAALTKAGLATQEQRDEARKELGI